MSSTFQTSSPYLRSRASSRIAAGLPELTLSESGTTAPPSIPSVGCQSSFARTVSGCELDELADLEQPPISRLSEEFILMCMEDAYEVPNLLSSSEKFFCLSCCVFACACSVCSSLCFPIYDIALRLITSTVGLYVGIIVIVHHFSRFV